MKISAIIILLGFLTYFSETITLPLTGKCTVAGNQTCRTAINSGLCTLTARPAKQPQKPAQGCTNSGICMDCPLCYNMVAANYKAPIVPFVIYKAKYVTIERNALPGFATKKWKPPISG